MTNLLSVSAYIAQQLSARAAGALSSWEFVGELAAPAELTERRAVVELHRSTELLPGNMSCRVEGRILASGGGDSEADTPAIADELRQLQDLAAETLTSLSGTAPALDDLGNVVIFYRVECGQQTLQPDRNFAQLLTVLTFTAFLQL